MIDFGFYYTNSAVHRSFVCVTETMCTLYTFCTRDACFLLCYEFMIFHRKRENIFSIDLIAILYHLPAKNIHIDSYNNNLFIYVF